MKGGGGGRFCGRGPLPMIVRNLGAGTVRPAWPRPETGVARDIVPLWVGFPGHGGLRPGASRQGRVSCPHCSTVVLWEQVPARWMRADPE
jgi:hypothetical protein